MITMGIVITVGSILYLAVGIVVAAWMRAISEAEEVTEREEIWLGVIFTITWPPLLFFVWISTAVSFLTEKFKAEKKKQEKKKEEVK